MNTFGTYIKQERLNRDIGLREFSMLVGIEASNYSKIERGLKRAPTGERLTPFVKALGFEPHGKEHQNMDVLASIANGEIPSKVLTDEVLAAKLPILFNGLAGGAFSQEQLDELLETIRQAHTPEVE